ncbi:hypothetical protein RFI_00326 [Reticulomyxa filosa]|uniref:TLDc domain-containing protein n=1 Tax=Reticulomyxa filosa TaxID=46433 RepID=X6PF55_RETFI|nr:hypothetical protein RFI_00326 [Reticulomyxa filosa]|eukprot:ETO36738.1 hypothetical protein RFI_00326 [Reticulomyxa filosa]
MDLRLNQMQSIKKNTLSKKDLVDQCIYQSTLLHICENFDQRFSQALETRTQLKPDKLDNNYSLQMQMCMHVTKLKSLIIKEEKEEKLLMLFLPTEKQNKITLLYQRSIDGFTAAKSHQRFNEKGATLTILQDEVGHDGYGSCFGIAKKKQFVCYVDKLVQMFDLFELFM